MSASPAIVRQPTILDAPERRFPLDLGVRIPKIRRLFHAATRSQWDPRKDIAWDQVERSQYTQEQLYAAREYWSRRAWAEYGAISESPAIQIRFCQNRHEPDLQLFFTIRSQEEARHAEVCYLMAETLGGYIEEPIKAKYEQSVSTHGVRSMALDPQFSLDALIAALVCAAEEVAFDAFKHLVEITKCPVAKSVTQAIMRDEVRHCAFGWYYMDHRVPHLTPEDLDNVRAGVVTMIEKVEMNGYHNSWLAPDSPAAQAEVDADRITYEAGLGASIESEEKPVFIATIQRLRRRMRKWGIELPAFEHPKLGVI
ncbi:MAG: ferritin-like domain-containing protein [Chromatiales bacterium]|jgi:hypothetical protein|nr:ferritin-like domain-containing protein [Chromatiales bacterium]